VHALLKGATGLAYSTAACGNAIYGTLQRNKVLLWRFAKAYLNALYQAIRNNFRFCKLLQLGNAERALK